MLFQFKKGRTYFKALIPCATSRSYKEPIRRKIVKYETCLLRVYIEFF